MSSGKYERQAKVQIAIFATYLVIFLDILAVSIFIPHLVFRLKALNLSATYLSLILPAYGLVQIFACPLIGSIGDYYGRKSILIGCLGITSFTYFCLGFSSQWYIIFIVRAIAGFFKQTQLLGKGILSDLANQSQKHVLCAVLGHSEAFGSMGFIFGPAIGSYLKANYLNVEYGFTNQPEDPSFKFLCCISAGIMIVNMFIIATFIPSTTSNKLNVPVKKLKLSKLDKNLITSQYLNYKKDDDFCNENNNGASVEDDENKNEIRNRQLFSNNNNIDNNNSINYQEKLLNNFPYKIQYDNTTPTIKNDDINISENINCIKGDNDKVLNVPIFVAISFFFCLTIHTVRESMPIYILETFNISTIDYGYLLSTQSIISTPITFISGLIITKLYQQNSKLVVIHSGILQMVSVVIIYLNNISYQITWISLLCLTVANQYLGVGLKALALVNTTNSGAMLGFSQTSTAVSRTFASILIGAYINNCEQLIIFGCISALSAVLITYICVHETKALSHTKELNFKEKMS